MEKRKWLDKVYTVDTGQHLARFTEPAGSLDGIHPLTRCVAYVGRNYVQNLCPWPVSITYTTRDNPNVDSDMVLWINQIKRVRLYPYVMYHPLLPPAEPPHTLPPASTYFCIPNEAATSSTDDIVVRTSRTPEELTCTYENHGTHGYALVDQNGSGGFYQQRKMRNGANYIRVGGVLIPGQVFSTRVRDSTDCDLFTIPLPKLLPVTKENPPAPLYVPVVPRIERDSRHCMYLRRYSDPRLCRVVNNCLDERILHIDGFHIPTQFPPHHEAVFGERHCKKPMYHSRERTYQVMYRKYQGMQRKTLLIDSSPQRFVPTLYKALQEQKRFSFFGLRSQPSLKKSRVRVKFVGQTGEDVTGLSVAVAAMMDDEIGLFCREKESNITSLLKAEHDPELGTYKYAICSSGLGKSKQLLFPNPTSVGIPLRSRAVRKYARFIGSFMGLALNWVVMTRLHHQQYSASFLMPQLGHVDPLVYNCLLEDECRPSAQELKSSFMGHYIQEAVNQWTQFAPKSKTTLIDIIESINFLDVESETLLQTLVVNDPDSFPSSVFSSLSRHSTEGDVQPAFHSGGFGTGFRRAQHRFGFGESDEEFQLPGQADNFDVGDGPGAGNLAPPVRDRSRISSMSSHFEDTVRRHHQQDTVSSVGSFSSEVSVPLSDAEFQKLVELVMDTFFEDFSSKKNLFQEKAEGMETAFGELKAGFDRVFSKVRYAQAKKEADLSVSEVLALIEGQPPTAEDVIQHLVCDVQENNRNHLETCERFFSVVRGMTLEELQKLLRFVSSSDVVPKHKSPGYQILVRVSDNYRDPEMSYPSSQTCFKLIRLFYVPGETDEAFRNKVLGAIDSPRGEYHH